MRDLTPKILFALLLCCGIAALLGGCYEPDPDGLKQEVPSVYRHAMDGAPGSLDPAQASTLYANFMVVNLFDTLYRYKYLARPYELEPNLAQAMPEVSEDGLTYTIRIKPGVLFSDDESFSNGKGRTVTAEDFVYSIKRQFDPATRAAGSWLWAGRIAGLDDWKEQGADYDQQVPGLRAVDSQTIQIRLNAPYPQLVHTLAQGYSAVVPREAVEHHGPGFSLNPVGSGPYRLEHFDSTRATLERNPQFREEPFSLENEGYNASQITDADVRHGLESLEGQIPPFTDVIEVSFIAEEASRWNSLISDEVDFIKVPVTQFDSVLRQRQPPQIAEDLADRFRLGARQESGFVHTDFNMADPRIGYHPDPVQSERNHALRCAIIKAFDWQKRNEIFYYGIGHVFPGIIPPVAPEFNPDQDRKWVTRDLEAARQLLLDHGWDAENLPVLEYGLSSNVTLRQMFEQFRSFMGDLGYPSEKIKPLTYATDSDHSRAFRNREVMLVTTSWNMDYPDAENTVQLFYGPNASPGANNSNYDNETYNRLYRSSASMAESPMRTAIYNEMNDRVQEDCVSISGLSRTLILMWNRRVTMVPDRSFLGGYYFRFVATDVHPAQ